MPKLADRWECTATGFYILDDGELLGLETAIHRGILQAVRKARGHSQQEAAIIMRVSVSAVRKWETGIRTPEGLYKKAVEDYLLKGATDGGEPALQGKGEGEGREGGKSRGGPHRNEGRGILGQQRWRLWRRLGVLVLEGRRNF